MDIGLIALLRGINVGGHNKVPMKELRELFKQLGCGTVASYIASGNVVFEKKTSDRAALVAQLEGAVDETFGVKAAIVLRSFAEIAKVAKARPFGADTSDTFVTFLAGKPASKAAKALGALDIAPDEVKLVGSDVFLRYPNGLREARLTGALLERQLGVSGTNRNWRTVTRLAEMASEASRS